MTRHDIIAQGTVDTKQKTTMEEPGPSSIRPCRKCGGPVIQLEGPPYYCLSCGPPLNRARQAVTVWMGKRDYDLLEAAAIEKGKSVSIFMREVALRSVNRKRSKRNHTHHADSAVREKTA